MKFVMQFLLVFFTFLILPAYAANMDKKISVNYFDSLSQDQVVLALKNAQVKNCDEYIKKYFDTNDEKIVLQAMAYDVGLCVEQDLLKARDLYETGFRMNPIFPNLPVRLALIYEFGPPALQNFERADFLMRQIAISLAAASDFQTRMTIIKVFLNDKPVPDSLHNGIKWISVLLNEDFVKRKKIAKELEEQGYKDTDMLWSSLEVLPLQDRD